MSDILIPHSVSTARWPRGKASLAEVKRRHCPTRAEHLLEFPLALLERWDEEYVVKESTSSLVPRYPYWSYREYLQYHPDFRRTRDALRTHEVLMVKYVYVGTKTEIHNAVIRYDLRCSYCRMVGDTLSIYDDKEPCCDPFIEARDGNLSFEFPGVVALLNMRTKALIMRSDWCWETLGKEKELVAVYSRSGLFRLKYGWLKNIWIRCKTRRPIGDGEVQGVVYIEDVLKNSAMVSRKVQP